MGTRRASSTTTSTRWTTSWRRRSSRSRAQDLDLSARPMAEAASPTEALRVFFRTYTPADKDWAFQLWLDAWAEAARRPAIQATSRRLNLEWQGLLERTIREASRPARSPAPTRPAPRGGYCRCSTGWHSRSWPTGPRSPALTSWPGRPVSPSVSSGCPVGRWPTLRADLLAHEQHVGRAKQATVIATSATTCGHTRMKLWSSENSDGMRCCACG